MKSHKLTQVQVASAVKVSQPTVQRWLKGKMPDGNELFALADLFRISVDELLGRTPETYSEQNICVLHDAPPKKEIAKLTKIADNLAEQIVELRKAIEELKS